MELLIKLYKQYEKKINHYGYDKQQCKLYEENVRAVCGKFIDEALKQQKEEIMEMIEKLELSLTTEPDKPKRGRPRKYPQVRVKRVYPYNDAYNQALFDIKSKLSDR